MVSFEGEAEDRVVAGSNPALGTTDRPWTHCEMSRRSLGLFSVSEEFYAFYFTDVLKSGFD